MTQLFNLISTKDITMLKDIDLRVDIDKRGKFKYYYITNMDIRSIFAFINRLHDNTIYTIIPLISISAIDNDPHIILSKQILITNNSSTKIVHDFLSEKLNQATTDFGLNNLEEGQRFHLIFKYKEIVLDLTKIPK